jgi:signal transduction histidine kinase
LDRIDGQLAERITLIEEEGEGSTLRRLVGARFRIDGARKKERNPSGIIDASFPRAESATPHAIYMFRRAFDR